MLGWTRLLLDQIQSTSCPAYLPYCSRSLSFLPSVSHSYLLQSCFAILLSVFFQCFLFLFCFSFTFFCFPCFSLSLVFFPDVSFAGYSLVSSIIYMSFFPFFIIYIFHLRNAFFLSFLCSFLSWFLSYRIYFSLFLPLFPSSILFFITLFMLTSFCTYFFVFCLISLISFLIFFPFHSYPHSLFPFFLTLSYEFLSFFLCFSVFSELPQPKNKTFQFCSISVKFSEKMSTPVVSNCYFVRDLCRKFRMRRGNTTPRPDFPSRGGNVVLSSRRGRSGPTS
jgi:hypothetical protein